MAQRKQFPGALKAKVAIETIRSEKTVNEIASIYQVHPKQVYKWKRQELDLLTKVMFDRWAEEHTCLKLRQQLSNHFSQITQTLKFSIFNFRFTIYNRRNELSIYDCRMTIEIENCKS